VATSRSRSARILVVDDDDGVRNLLVRYLDLEGYAVDAVKDARAAVACMLEHRPDLMLLDVMLPVQDGFDFLSQLRRTTDVPVIMLTARDEGSSRVLGLRLGADDYIVKPFALDELSARIEAVLRRGGRRSSSTLEFDRLRIDVDARKVTVDGTPLELTAKEFDVLLFLASAPGQVFTRQQLLEQVWGSSSEWQDPRTVTEHVRRLRQKLESAGGDRPWLQTVRGVGYRFDR
jgi:DNA-binding response OmpR family regulator